MKLFISLLTLMFCHALSAEIQQVRLRWNPAFCNAGCGQSLARNLASVPGVAAVNMNQPAGQADLPWLAGMQFSLNTLNLAVSRTGVFINTIGMRVRGTIRIRGNAFSLVSLGDNTLFSLIGPLQVQPGRLISIDAFSMQSFPMSQQLVAQLTQAMQNNLTVIVDGFLNFWLGTQLLYLSVQTVSVVVPTAT